MDLPEQRISLTKQRAISDPSVGVARKRFLAGKKPREHPVDRKIVGRALAKTS